MTPEEQKTIDRLIEAINLAHNSSGRLFWRGFLWGLGRGLGATVGLAIVLGVAYYFLRASGLDETFRAAMQNLEDLSKSFNSIRQ